MLLGKTGIGLHITTSNVNRTMMIDHNCENNIFKNLLIFNEEN